MYQKNPEDSYTMGVSQSPEPMSRIIIPKRKQPSTTEIKRKKTNIFVPLSETIICAVCQKQSSNAILTLYCGHIICSNCTEKAQRDIKFLNFSCHYCKANNPISNLLI